MRVSLSRFTLILSLIAAVTIGANNGKNKDDDDVIHSSSQTVISSDNPNNHPNVDKIDKSNDDVIYSNNEKGLSSSEQDENGMDDTLESMKQQSIQNNNNNNKDTTTTNNNSNHYNDNDNSEIKQKSNPSSKRTNDEVKQQNIDEEETTQFSSNPINSDNSNTISSSSSNNNNPENKPSSTNEKHEINSNNDNNNSDEPLEESQNLRKNEGNNEINSSTIKSNTVQSEDEEGKRNNSNMSKKEGGDKNQKKILVDYASKSVGALILDKSPYDFKGTSNLLISDRDRYAIAPCENPEDGGRGGEKYVVLGLSEDILVKTVKLANFERYSSHVHTFQILGSQTYPIGEWADLGTYTVQTGSSTKSSALGEHSFDLVEPGWARYLKFQFLKFYGDEHYCTVSQIKVHGSTTLQDFHEMRWEDDLSINNDDDDNNNSENEDGVVIAEQGQEDEQPLTHIHGNKNEPTNQHKNNDNNVHLDIGKIKNEDDNPPQQKEQQQDNNNNNNNNMHNQKKEWDGNEPILQEDKSSSSSANSNIKKDVSSETNSGNKNSNNHHEVVLENEEGYVIKEKIDKKDLTNKQQTNNGKSNQDKLGPKTSSHSENIIDDKNTILVGNEDVDSRYNGDEEKHNTDYPKKQHSDADLDIEQKQSEDSKNEFHTDNDDIDTNNKNMMNVPTNSVDKSQNNTYKQESSLDSNHVENTNDPTLDNEATPKKENMTKVPNSPDTTPSKNTDESNKATERQDTDFSDSDSITDKSSTMKTGHSESSTHIESDKDHVSDPNQKNQVPKKDDGEHDEFEFNPDQLVSLGKIKVHGANTGMTTAENLENNPKKESITSSSDEALTDQESDHLSREDPNSSMEKEPNINDSSSETKDNLGHDEITKNVVSSDEIHVEKQSSGGKDNSYSATMSTVVTDAIQKVKDATKVKGAVQEIRNMIKTTMTSSGTTRAATESNEKNEKLVEVNDKNHQTGDDIDENKKKPIRSGEESTTEGNRVQKAIKGTNSKFNEDDPSPEPISTTVPGTPIRMNENNKNTIKASMIQQLSTDLSSLSSEMIADFSSRFPSITCLSNLNYSEWKNKLKSSSNNKGSSSNQINAATQTHASLGSKNEPIFKKLTDEIKSLHATQSLYESYIRALSTCYNQVLMEMIREQTLSEQVQANKMLTLESQMASLISDYHTFQENNGSAYWKKEMLNAMEGLSEIIFEPIYTLIEPFIDTVKYHFNSFWHNKKLRNNLHNIIEIIAYYDREAIAFAAGSFFCLIVTGYIHWVHRRREKKVKKTRKKKKKSGRRSVNGTPIRFQHGKTDEVRGGSLSVVSWEEVSDSCSSTVINTDIVVQQS